MKNNGYLLDTCALIVGVWEPEKIGKHAKLIMDTHNDVFMSMASMWEIALKCGSGKLKGDSRHYHSVLAGAGIDLLPIEAEDLHGLQALKQWRHKDPFDRLLVSCARRLDLVIVSSDAAIKRYYKNVIW